MVLCWLLKAIQVITKRHQVSGFELDSNYFVSGLKKDNDQFVNSGGRVILAIGEGQNIKEAQAAAYKRVKKDKEQSLVL